MRLWEQLGRVKDYYRGFRDFRARGESVYALERLAQLVIQSLLDLGAMIAIYRASRKPETYGGVALFIARELGLDHSYESFLSDLAGFGNVLVHGYASIDRYLEERAFREIEGRLGFVIDRLEDYLKRLSIDPNHHELSVRLSNVFSKHGVDFAFLFGSRARGDYRPSNDFDFAVYGRFGSALDLGGLIVDIAEALGVSEDLVDVVLLDSASPGLIYTVVNEGVLVYGDPEVAFGYLIRRYLELLDFWSFISQLV